MITNFKLTDSDVLKVKEFVTQVNKDKGPMKRYVEGIEIRFWFEPCNIGMGYGVDYRGETLDLTDVSTW